jgi:hypothetical protein
LTVGDASVTVGGTADTSLPIDLTSTRVPDKHIPTADLASLAPGQSIVLHVDFVLRGAWSSSSRGSGSPIADS